MAETVRYMARCRTCPRKGAVDAEMFTITLQGRTYTWPAIPVLDEDHDDYTRRLKQENDKSYRGPAPQMQPDFLRVPQPPSWTRFSLDMNGVARRVLIRVGLWCPDCNDQMRVKPLKATRNDAKRCNDVCLRATSTTCDCSCGGQNHGKAWLASAVRIGAV